MAFFSDVDKDLGGVVQSKSKSQKIKKGRAHGFREGWSSDGDGQILILGRWVREGWEMEIRHPCVASWELPLATGGYSSKSNNVDAGIVLNAPPSPPHLCRCRPDSSG